MAGSLYFTLGVHHDATQKRIATVYTTVMRDLEVGGYVSTPIRAAQRAFSVLGHPPSRRVYDNTFAGIVNEETRATTRDESIFTQPAPSHRADLGAMSLARSFRTSHPSFEEIFDRLWSNFAARSRPKAETTRSLTVEIPITRDQAMTGGAAEVMVPALVECGVCRGTGGVGTFLCARCDGRGAVAGEYPLRVAFPPGHAQYTVQVPLSSLGIQNFYLTVHFRMTGIQDF